MIEIVRNRGALVRRLSMRDALELFQIRTELEALACRLAAGNIGDPAVRARFEGETAPVWLQFPRHSTADYIAENRRFHAAIFAAAGNLQLIELNRKLQLSLILSQISSQLTSTVIAASLAEHREIAGHILSGDAAGAEGAVRSHLRRASDFMQSLSPGVFRRDGPVPAQVQ
jgi:DNA-binding GntR family transcriptional regulator